MRRPDQRRRYEIPLRPTAPLTERAACAALGLRPPCSLEEARKAYRALARQHHPDMGGDEERFKEINAAFSLIEELCA
ncbi:MAG: J domain-containing protein, partial [Deltaproteobacteria bacterium]|nr:J domain-containing protein [Deltaproteobacteria bacterium]